MRSPLATLLPLGSALGYTVAALMLKRATESGGGPWRVNFLVNWVAALAFLPWLLQGGEPFAPVPVALAALTGLTFFIGQIFTFLALSRGDVSLTTPIMGTKVVFVALLGAAFAGEKPSPALWCATLLTCVATALLGGEFKTNAARLLPSLGFGITAAFAYAAADIMQQRWVQHLGFGHFAPVMFLTIGLLALGLIPFFNAPLRQLSKPTWFWILGGAVLIALQATGIAFSIALFKEVTLTNVLYTTRGIWSVLLVWSIGSWFGNTEKAVGSSVMIQRLLGATLLLGAVLLGLQGR
jgi:drug/metabolite transporter (DMT)-like permease